jgi:hypothetical protein
MTYARYRAGIFRITMNQRVNQSTGRVYTARRRTVRVAPRRAEGVLEA